MARSKNIEAFCSFCNGVTKMEITGERGENPESSIRWAKCKKCKQVMCIDLQNLGIEAKPTVEQVSSSTSKEYSPMSSFKVGESIFHKGWNDYGIVVSKDVTSNGRSSIVVEFQNSGIKKLIETLR